MKCFQSVQKYMAYLGVSKIRKPFNKRIMIAFLLCVANSALVCAFPILETISFEEYIVVIYIASATVMVAIFFAIAAFEMTNIFTLLGNAEQIAENSEH